MSVSIIPCPSCKTLLLSDTGRCPTCQHVLNPESVDADGATAVVTAPEADDADQLGGEIECPDCGESVRQELVRCWQCGTFLRKDIEESYQQKRQNITRVTFTPLPEHHEPESDADALPLSGGDDDFELQPGIAARDATESGNVAAAPEMDAASKPAPQLTDAETYSLTPPPPTAQTTAPPAGTTTPAEAAQTPPTEATPAQSTEEEATDEAGQTMQPKPDVADKPPDEIADNAPGETADGESHSVATGGDALLDIALQEEKEIHEGRKSRVSSTSLGSDDIVLTPGAAIFCHSGTAGKAEPVPLLAKPQGLLGKCQSCNVSIFIPNESWYEERRQKKKKKEEGEAHAEAVQMEDKFNLWLTDVRVHTVDPQKLKLKPGALEAAFEPYDLGFSKEEMLVVSLAGKGGLFGKSDKNIPEAREAMLAYIKEGQPIEGLPAATHWIVAAEQVQQMPIAHPAPYAHESMFAGIPVFGDGKIAIKLPQREGSSELQFASLTLTEFRELAAILSDRFSVVEYGEVLGIPLQNKTEQLKCHYSEVEFEILHDLEYYQADPKITVKLVGRRCQECGLVVGEDARKKEKIGGAAGKGIAKAKCPKCEKKFGDISLYAIDEEAMAPKTEDTPPAEQTTT